VLLLWLPAMNAALLACAGGRTKEDR